MAAGACVMQTHAQTASSMVYNNTLVLPIDSVPSSDYVELNYNISLSYAKNFGQDICFSVCLVSGEKYIWNNSAQYLKLTNADEIDVSILSNADDKWGNNSSSEYSKYSNFTPMGEGTVTLKYEGDIIVKKGNKGTWSWLTWSYSGGSPDETRHIKVDVVVTVSE